MFVGAFDPRLKVIVSSCGWTPFHDYYGGKIAGWTSDRYMPRLRTCTSLNPDRVPFDFYEVVAALAPRGFFSNSPLGDDNFAVAGREEGGGQGPRGVRPAGRRRPAAGPLSRQRPRLPARRRREAYAFRRPNPESPAACNVPAVR